MQEVFYDDGEGFIQTRLKNSRTSQDKRIRRSGTIPKTKTLDDGEDQEEAMDVALLEDNEAKEMVSPVQCRAGYSSEKVLYQRGIILQFGKIIF